jgi:hypothetical protein
MNNRGGRYEVGVLRNVECISKEKSEAVYQEYRRRKWLDKMIQDLEQENANVKKFRQTIPREFVNIKFKIEDATIHEEMIEINPEDVNITATYFKLLDKKTPEMAYTDVPANDTDTEDDAVGNHLKSTSKRKKVFSLECEYDPYHDQMQNALFKKLNSGYEGYRNVKIEHGHVDVKAKAKNGKWHYFEIKTDGPRLTIRKALGQIMEYAYYPALEKAERLIVIGDEEPDPDAASYLRYIRERFDLKVYYRAFNMKNGNLSREF